MTYNRIINNVTMAMPHPGVYAAAMDPANAILQPMDLDGVGEYAIRAAVVSPAVNVLCANLAANELAPLVYTTWPRARTNTTGVPGQRIGAPDWQVDVPAFSKTDFGNATVVDEVFRWGAQYNRRPPVFQMVRAFWFLRFDLLDTLVGRPAALTNLQYPADYNMITNSTVFGSDSIYILSKSAAMANYTLCQLRSWLTPNCSTRFNVSGTTGGHMEAHCEDVRDRNSYVADFPALNRSFPQGDWRVSILSSKQLVFPCGFCLISAPKTC